MKFIVRSVFPSIYFTDLPRLGCLAPSALEPEPAPVSRSKAWVSAPKSPPARQARRLRAC